MDNLINLIIALAALYIAYLGHKYTKDRDKEERERKRREANAAVVDILAAWVHYSWVPNANIAEKNRLIHELQTTYWKSALWIDRDLLIELNSRLNGVEGAPGVNDLIVKTRKHVQGVEPDITRNDIVGWRDIVTRDRILDQLTTHGGEMTWDALRYRLDVGSEELNKNLVDLEKKGRIKRMAGEHGELISLSGLPFLARGGDF
jgi:hypothetical protein